MARPLRIEYPGAFYHVISRGNGGQAIYKSKRDREKFLDYLGKMVQRYAVRIHCYCMMTNHCHLLIETPEANLSKAIQWLNVSYAMGDIRVRSTLSIIQITEDPIMDNVDQTVPLVLQEKTNVNAVKHRQRKQAKEACRCQDPRPGSYGSMKALIFLDKTCANTMASCSSSLLDRMFNHSCEISGKPSESTPV